MTPDSNQTQGNHSAAEVLHNHTIITSNVTLEFGRPVKRKLNYKVNGCPACEANFKREG